jgi:predicted nucleotidyltransferase
LKPETVSLVRLKEQFGTSTPRRQFLFEKFRTVFDLLQETGKVKHVYLFGSFTTENPSPNDVDLFVVMRAGFTTVELNRKVLSVFTHDVCRIRYNVDVFWVTNTVGEDQIKEMLDVFSRNRMHQTQPILEVTR